MFLVSTLEKGSAQNIFPVSTAGKTLKEKIFFVSTYIDKYTIFLSSVQDSVLILSIFQIKIHQKHKTNIVKKANQSLT